jgi:hypothetical protein
MIAAIIPITIQNTKIRTIPIKLPYIMNSIISFQINTAIPITIPTIIYSAIPIIKNTMISTTILSTIDNKIILQHLKFLLQYLQ